MPFSLPTCITAVFCLPELAAADQGGKTHVLAILADDFGWQNAGWHARKNPSAGGVGSPNEVARTPHMDSLVDAGMELDRQYAFKFCSPTRSAIQSGRNPIHVNVQNMDPLNVNPADPVSGFSAVARNFTGLGTVMQRANYSTHFAGKWDCGMVSGLIALMMSDGSDDAWQATRDHTPLGRGYQ